MDNIVPTEAPSVYAQISSLANKTSQLAIVRPNNPPPGIAGFLFNIVTDDAVDLESEITDHYIEDNTSIQDHIALRPETVSVRGLVAELASAQTDESKVAPAPSPLMLVPGFVPTFTPGAVQTTAQLQLAPTLQNAATADSNSLSQFYTSRSPQQPNQTKQSYIFGYFYQLWKGRQLFSVETPWGVWNNMAILSGNFTQGEETKSVSDMRMVFKRLSKVKALTISQGNVYGRAVSQQANTTQNGVLGLPSLTYAESQTALSNWNPTK